jgi:tryptophan synthase alpha chain
MGELDDNRVVRTFAELRAAGKKALVPFLTAGYPDAAATEALLDDLEARGVRVCELGVPFSDPIADGPTIQGSYTAALQAGVRSPHVLDMVRRYRDGGGKMALAAMVSYSIVFRHGVGEYAASAAEAGFDALIVPDLPVDEAAEVEPVARARGLANILLIAPTTPPPRRVEIAAGSRGFLYFISVAGITGQRDRLPEESIAAVGELKRHTDTPVCVGFGISRPEMVAGVCEVADGAIVGSAIIRRITDAGAAPPARLVAKVGRFVSELLAPIQ